SRPARSVWLSGRLLPSDSDERAGQIRQERTRGKRTMGMIEEMLDDAMSEGWSAGPVWRSTQRFGELINSSNNLEYLEKDERTNL
ncbi:hypothetical protein AKJ16_DCAP17598, partial [Drosera capensis]